LIDTLSGSELQTNVGPALNGVRVLVTGASLAGHICGTFLGEYGADVLRVEPDDGDPLRRCGPLFRGGGLRWASAARSSRSVVLRGDELDRANELQGLRAWADVGCDSTGASYEASPPVLVRFSVLGPQAPLEPATGDGLVAAARGGLLEVTGYPDGPPMRLGADVIEHLTAAYAAEAAIAGLLYRHRTGENVFIEADSLGATLRILEWTLVAQAATGTTRRREGNSPTALAPIGVYRAADGLQIGLVGASPANFRRLVQAMDRPELLDDERFSSPEARATHAGAINSIVGAWVASLPGAEVVGRAEAADVIVGTALTLTELLDDEHIRARGDLISVVDPGCGPLTQVAPQPHTDLHCAMISPAPPPPALG
jgi:crotonobetainyl-CoA:carnitine CoA-transferase CaiB-like acyl-CoA transferase